MGEIRVGIPGITGRMGRMLGKAAMETPGIALGAASSRSNEDLVGHDVGLFVGGPQAGVAISGSLEYCHANFDVAVDFTMPEYTIEMANICASHNKGLVIGTTAHDKAQMAAIDEIAKRIPIVMAPNMSVGINLMLNLLTAMAQTVGSDADVDVVEVHHRGKRDAPSGTALALGEAVAQGRNQEFPACASFDALKTGELRDPATIHFHILRQTNMVGEHQVSFALNGERLELTHKASDREVFARGAMRAAAWVAGREPGLYSMQDVLAE